MANCSNCGSSNVQFRRENVGEVRGRGAKQVVHRTVGYCKDCGNTWVASSDEIAVPRKRKTWLWVLGWLFIFPVPLTILLLRKKDMNSVLKYAIIAIAWIVYLAFGISGNKNDETTAHSPGQSTQTSLENTATRTEETLSFVLKDGETGEFGVEVVLNAGTEFEEKEITYAVPVGVYLVKNLNASGSEQVSVYSGGPEKDGEWETFVADNNCAKPIVVMAGETKELEIKEGQFVVLSDNASNIQFTMK